RPDPWRPDPWHPRCPGPASRSTPRRPFPSRLSPRPARMRRSAHDGACWRSLRSRGSRAVPAALCPTARLGRCAPSLPAGRGRRRVTGALPPPRAGTPTGPSRLPPRQVLADDVYEAVKALVMDHVIAPGARVSIDGLARQLGVSQTPIREALARLESDGLVIKAPLRGYSATPLLTRAEVDDLFQFRLLIEPWVAGRAAELASRDDHRRIAAEIASCPEAPPSDAYEEFKALAGHDNRFHTLLATLAGNQQ